MLPRTGFPLYVAPVSDPASRFHLRTFGPPALLGANGDLILGGHGHHHRRLALLAVLAAAGEQGRSRDHLLLLFWPEATQARARHSLDQLLYAIRNALGEAVFAGVSPVVLRADVVGSDVGAFTRALQRNELVTAVDEYRGPFLDGFRLTDAPEFERWAEGERTRIATEYASALERLAREAALASDFPTAVRRWRQLAELDPLSDTYAAGLMSALRDAGDHTAALQHARRHEELVGQELGASAGPAISELVQSIRGAAADETPAVAAATNRRTSRSRLLPYMVAGTIIVASVAALLTIRPGSRRPPGRAARTTSNVAAFERYQRGIDPANTRSDSAARAALEYFRQAIALDSNFAAAHAGLARAYLRSPIIGVRAVPMRERVELAEQAALRAVALDDSLGDAHATLSLVRRMQLDMVSAEAEIKRAIALEPENARFHEFLVQLYVWLDRPADALAEGRRAVALDKLSPTAHAELARALLVNGRCDEALAELAPLEALRPQLLRANTTAAACYAEKKMWPQAIAELRRSGDTSPKTQALVAHMNARAGNTGEARRILASLLDSSRRVPPTSGDVALIHAGLGDRDATFAWLEKAADDRSLAFDWFPPLLKDLRGDERFERFRRRMGIPAK